MSSFKDLLAPTTTKSFVSESALAAERESLIASYLAQGKQPPAHLTNPDAAHVVDARPLADRLAEQRRIKEDELEAKLSLRNHVPMLDEDDSEYLNDVAEQERRDEVERRKRETAEVERFREMQRLEEDEVSKVGLDPEAVVRVVAERAMAGVGVGKSLVREMLLATDEAEAEAEAQAAPVGGSNGATKSKPGSFLGSADDRKRRANKQRGMVALVVPKKSSAATTPADAVLAAPSKRSASAVREADQEEQSKPSSPVKKARTGAGGMATAAAAVPVVVVPARAAAGGNGLVAYDSDDEDDD